MPEPTRANEHIARVVEAQRLAEAVCVPMATVPFVSPTVCFVAIGIAVMSSTGGSANQDAAWATYDACRSDNRLGDFSSVLYKCLSC
jgi:hypothetical protein